MDNDTSTLLIGIGFVVAFSILVLFLSFRGRAGQDFREHLAKQQPVPPMPPKNRKERRKLEFAAKSEKDMQAHRFFGQYEAEKRYKDALDVETSVAITQGLSVYAFTQKVLALAEEAIVYHLAQVKDKERLQCVVPRYSLAVMNQACSAIAFYARGLNLQSVTVDLERFLEKHFGIYGIDEALKAQRGRYQYNHRCEAMTNAILGYFCDFDCVPPSKQPLNTPFDDIQSTELLPLATFQAQFTSQVINQAYPELIAGYSRVNYDRESNEDRRAREKNKRHRAKRMSRQNSRHRSRQY